MTAKLAVALIAASVLAPLGRAYAGAANDARICAGTTTGERIAACTALMGETHLDNANLSNVYFDRGNAYLAAGKTDLAIADFDKALALQPGFSDALLNRAAARSRRGDYDAAVADYSALLKQDPADLRTMLNRAIARGNAKDYRGALADFGAVAQSSPKTSNAWSGLCWIHAVSGMGPNSGIAACNEAVALNPGDTSVLGYRALLSFRLGDFDAAVVDYDAALAKDPRSATFLYGRGMTKLRDGNPTGANEDIAAAKALDARIVQTFMGYGIAP